MSNWWRTRIQRKKKPIVQIVLIRRKSGRIEPEPVFRLNLVGGDIFTKQPNGHYWVTAHVDLPDGTAINPENERAKYEYFMDLNSGHSLEKVMPDWSLWEDKGQSLKEARISAYLHINDRNCCLADPERPSTIDLLDQ